MVPLQTALQESTYGGFGHRWGRRDCLVCVCCVCVWNIVLKEDCRTFLKASGQEKIGLVPQLSAVGVMRQRVHCGIPITLGPGNYFLLEGGAIASSDLTDIGLSETIVCQHDRYAIWIFHKGNKCGGSLEPKQSQGTDEPGRRRSSLLELGTCFSVQLCVGLLPR